MYRYLYCMPTYIPSGIHAGVVELRVWRDGVEEERKGGILNEQMMA
jgi:hypothetical protein